MNFTIITINLNNADGLEKTILSVLSQTYKKIQHIIIDGRSQDKSQNIIEKYSSYGVYGISESDKGIYDAMNKGISNITSDEGYTLFLNSGDTFNDSNVLNKLNSYIIQNCITSDVFLYGDHIYKRKNQRKHIMGKNIKYILKGMPFSHQSIFLPNHFMKRNKYSLIYSIAGDYDYFIRAWKKKSIFEYVPIIISDVEGGGISDINRIKGIRERMYSLKNHGLLTRKLKGWYVLRIIRTYITEYLKKTLKNL